jgi:xylose isomerase
MIIGSINFWEILEFFYYLNKTDYEGWSTIDIIAARDDRTKSLELAVDLTWKYKELADRLSKHSDEIDANVKGNRFSDNMNLLMDILFR